MYQNLSYRVFYDKKVYGVRNWYYKNNTQEHSKANAKGRIQIGKGVNINGPILKAKLEELAKKLGRNDFKATDKNFSADDIYNADETGLYYRARPDGSLCYKHIALSGYKKAVDRITLLIKGKSARPRCFKRLRMEGIPVEYHAKKNAKILLLVDNGAAHPLLDHLQNIQLEFLPRNTTSFNATIGHKGNKNFKTLYSGKLVNLILESIDENLLTSSTTAREISSKISLLQEIQLVADSWRAIKTTTIQNCFTNCGFRPLDISEILSNEENEDMLPVRIINYEEFSTIDNNLPCYDNNEDCDDLIVEGIKSKHEKFEEDDDNDDESPVPVTNHEAKKCMAVLQGYFMQEGNEGSPTSALKIFADFVEFKCYKNKRQTTLDSF
ncbi:hypothetical protein RF11_15273 [Thelohanellus kitauei]|uniref:DDE-1 domain-containing protein n=1 Tax=Thelohanellus kitauei TaxID=669202 RepID=A0A0C2IMY6_THEKT|nr:hypothetical protein RF11_15273 [Thelohanellus kitauei]